MASLGQAIGYGNLIRLDIVLVYDYQIISVFLLEERHGPIQISQAQGHVPVTVFHLPERVNLGNFAELEETAKEAYNNGMRDLVIDLSQTISLTSIGIRAIVVIHKMLATDRAKHLK